MVFNDGNFIISTIGTELEINNNLVLQFAGLILGSTKFQLVDNQVQFFRKHILDDIDRVIVNKVNHFLFLHAFFIFLPVHHILSFYPFIFAFVLVQSQLDDLNDIIILHQALKPTFVLLFASLILIHIQLRFGFFLFLSLFQLPNAAVLGNRRIKDIIFFIDVKQGMKVALSLILVGRRECGISQWACFLFIKHQILSHL